MIICGIDPGLSGAIAWLRKDGRVVVVVDMPILKLRRNGKGEVDPDILADNLESHRPDHIFVEKVGPMPGQGVSSVFSFGHTAGGILGVIATLKIPRTYVSPQRWKRLLRVPAPKDGARARASELMPNGSPYWRRVKDDGRAEAAMIAYYGLIHMRMENVLTSTNDTRACLEGDDPAVL